MVCGVKQHTGKTSVSMSLVAGLRNVFGENQASGQPSVCVPGESARADVVLFFFNRWPS